MDRKITHRILGLDGEDSWESLGLQGDPWCLRVCLQRGRPRFNPWVGKIPWRRKWQPIPVFLPGESHGRRSLVGYSPRGRKESDTTEHLHFTSLHFTSLESPLDCKEIKLVYSKGNQSWIFTGRTDAEAETPILWPPDANSWLIG